MSIKLDISLASRQYTQGQQIVDVNGSTIDQCLGDLIKQFPRIKQGLFDGNGKLHSHIDIYVNGESAYPEMLAKPVKDGDELRVVFLIAGG